MSVPNPFSMANALQHIVTPKIIGPTAGSYQVAVDIVDVDTMYSRQVGSTASRVSDIYVGTIHALSYDPIPAGATGATGLPGPTVGVTGGTGIGVTFNGTTYAVSSTLQLIAGANVGITQSGSSYTISAVGLTGATGAPGPTGSSVTGPTGQLAYFTSSGLTSSNQIVFDGIGSLNAPTTVISNSSSPAVLRLITFNDRCYVQASSTDVVRSPGFLDITKTYSGALATATFDTGNRYVGINNSTPETYLDVNGQTVITYDSRLVPGDDNIFLSSGVSGTTGLTAGSYVLYGWGGGGLGNGGTGGAGGYTQVQFNVGASGGTFAWGPVNSGPGGGGPSMQVTFNGSTFSWIPGGGAGGTFGGQGGAAGEYGLPYPEGGSNVGGTATFIDNTDWAYTIPAGSLTGATFANGTIAGLTATCQNGTIFNFSTVANSSGSSGGYQYYTFSSPTTLTISNPTFLFSNTTLTTPDTSFIGNNVTFGTTGGTGSTGSTGTAYALFNPWPGSTATILGNPRIVTTSAPTIGTGNVSWNPTAIGEYVQFSPTIPFTLSFAQPNALSEIAPNKTILSTGTNTVSFSQSLPAITGTLYTDAVVTVPASTALVNYREFVNRGASATGSAGAFGGGAGFTGGAAAGGVTGVFGYTGSYFSSTNEPAGAGPGTWGMTGVTGISLDSPINNPGSGTAPYINYYNPGGTYGAGNGGAPFLALERIPNSNESLPALIVNGDEDVEGGVRANFVTAGALGTIPAGGTIGSFPTQSGGKMMWNSVAPGNGRTEFVNARGAGAVGRGFAFYTGADGATAGQVTNIAVMDTTGVTINGNLLVGSGAPTTVNLIPSGGTFTALGLGGNFTVGDNTTIGTTIALNGSVGALALSVTNNISAASGNFSGGITLAATLAAQTVNVSGNLSAASYIPPLAGLAYAGPLTMNGGSYTGVRLWDFQALAYTPGTYYLQTIADGTTDASNTRARQVSAFIIWNGTMTYGMTNNNIPASFSSDWTMVLCGSSTQSTYYPVGPTSVGIFNNGGSTNLSYNVSIFKVM